MISPFNVRYIRICRARPFMILHSALWVLPLMSLQESNFVLLLLFFRWVLLQSVKVVWCLVFVQFWHQVISCLWLYRWRPRKLFRRWGYISLIHPLISKHLLRRYSQLGMRLKDLPNQALGTVRNHLPLIFDNLTDINRESILRWRYFPHQIILKLSYERSFTCKEHK